VAGWLGTEWFVAVAAGHGAIRDRTEWGRSVPGVSWRPWQAVAATRRPGREGLVGKYTGSCVVRRERHGDVTFGMARPGSRALLWSFGGV
jgi:hypothetical protein